MSLIHYRYPLIEEESVLYFEVSYYDIQPT